jgi:hypothetical protein
MYTKLFSSILDSSVWLEDLPTKVLWITMLAMADEDEIVAASVGGLAKRAGIERDQCERGLARFLAPDPDSRSEEHEGRRIEKVPGGWMLLNHGAYREIRTARQLKEAERQRRHREKLARQQKGDVTVTGVTERDSHDASQPSRPTPPIASASASVSEGSSEEGQEPVGREERRDFAADPLDGVLDDAGLDLAEFDPHGAVEVRAFLRSLRSPFPAATILRSHLRDEQCPAKALVIAVREYAALGRDRLEARHFAGFVRKAKADVAQAPARAMGRSEERFITSEDVEAERARREEAETDAMLRDFERRHEEQWLELCAQAQSMVDTRIKGEFRAPMVASAVAKLVRQWLSDNEGGRRAAS